ncbi:IMP dehydrogenase, partial [Saccharophagus degradans]|nr:IMP dehydrogenase [Saccharophagus degradans]
PNTVSIKSMFTRNISLNTPIVSAAMDTVTEFRMAIAIAREGGIGVIHKNMSIKEQAKQVKKVKRSEAGMILEPVTISASQTVLDANKLM